MFPPRNVNELVFDQIVAHMETTFNPTTFLVRERYKFWTNCRRNPGETIHELATKIRQAAATCDFASIRNPLDEALRTSFICNVQNEAVLKALFRIPENELSFAKAIGIADEIESAALVAKDTVYGGVFASRHCSGGPFRTKFKKKKKITNMTDPKTISNNSTHPRSSRLVKQVQI